jgi:DNA invertase Pin-like site-specific DNA recombinase
MRAAIYARVSTERQERQQTIASQVSALRDWAAAAGHALAEAYVFQGQTRRSRRQPQGSSIGGEHLRRCIHLFGRLRVTWLDRRVGGRHRARRGWLVCLAPSTSAWSGPSCWFHL